MTIQIKFIVPISAYVRSCYAKVAKVDERAFMTAQNVIVNISLRTALLMEPLVQLETKLMKLLRFEIITLPMISCIIDIVISHCRMIVLYHTVCECSY